MTHFINTDFSTFFDVDETLVFWKTDEDPNDEKVSILDPYTGAYIDLIPHKRHVELLKRKKSQGHVIVVWSAGGSEWAQSVVQGMGLEPYVDLVMAKPVQYVDDLPLEEWGAARCYLGKHVKGHPIRDHKREEY